MTVILRRVEQRGSNAKVSVNSGKMALKLAGQRGSDAKIHWITGQQEKSG
jgi:hypothetical protein